MSKQNSSEDLERFRITIDEYLVLMEEDPLPESRMAVLRTVLAEVKNFTPSFIAKNGELAELAEAHSPTFQGLPEERKNGLTSVLNGPVFFLSS